jgi:hypothetical protein
MVVMKCDERREGMTEYPVLGSDLWQSFLATDLSLGPLDHGEDRGKDAN